VRGGLGGAAYRGVMRVAARGARVASAMPGAPAEWRGLRDRLGELSTAQRAMASGASALWIHAASVGELNAVRPLVAQLRTRFPGRACVVSTLTRTGLALAEAMPEAHVALLFPLDAPRAVTRILEQVRLEAFFFTETEIWPTWLMTLAADGVPTFMVSGRVSERTVGRTRLLRPLYRAALASVTCCMQSDEDRARIITLGAEPLRTHVAGSLKFDASPAVVPDDVRRLGELLEGSGRRAIVAGSTHEGEEQAVIEAYDRVVRGHRDAVLLLAPRHPERLDDVAALVEARGLVLVRYSALAEAGDDALPEGPLVVLLDVVGPLAHCYGLGVVAFVGGSLVPVGGHNVIEPARAARPIIVGPHTANTRDVVDRLLAARAAIRVDSSEALAWTLDHLLAQPDEAVTMGRRAQVLVQTGQGAVERHMKIIAARMTRESFVRDGAA
jgi:3-deoxy-D-manno-octulosonic-acid transferase